VVLEFFFTVRQQSGRPWAATFLLGGGVPASEPTAKNVPAAGEWQAVIAES
jgi:hypothetical protein